MSSAAVNKPNKNLELPLGEIQCPMDNTIPKTPFQYRILLSRKYNALKNKSDWPLVFKSIRDAYLLNGDGRDLALSLWDQLRMDVDAVFDYRQRIGCMKITIDDLKYWFPSEAFNRDRGRGINYNYQLMHSWISQKYDFIYTAHGIRILINRYLKPKEPIQCCMLRIAKLFIGGNDRNIDYELWKLFYKTIACGFLQVSSILADAEEADNSIRPGEACCLLVATKKYDRTFVRQIEQVSTIISMGVGVGISMATVPLVGRIQNGYVHSGFRSVIRKLDACGYINIYERKPKIAIYINTHCDTIFEALDVRHPAKIHAENCFIGLMVSDYFMECVRLRKTWYLFPANLDLDGQNLSDLYGEEYIAKYEECVRRNLYTKSMPAVKLMENIVTSIAETGAPYIIFEDNVNKYSNHRHLGKVKTLNLCAEITNYSTDTDISSCTLISANMAMFMDFPLEQAFIKRYINQICGNYSDIIDNFTNMKSEAAFAFMLGYMGAWALNGLLGKERRRREIGINPMGVYDMAIMNNNDPVELCPVISEAMYMGAIISSCNYSQTYNVQCQNYPYSPFSKGEPQFVLRNIKPIADWTMVRSMMMRGMANSMLTSQAPTATTSQLTGVIESIMLPLNLITINESEAGRTRVVTYGLMSKLLLGTIDCNDIQLNNDIQHQIAMYEKSAPFIDHSQSTMFSIILNKQNIFNIIRDTYKAKLKTGIYYVLPIEHNKTLQIIKSPNMMNVNANNKKYPSTTKDINSDNDDGNYNNIGTDDNDHDDDDDDISTNKNHERENEKYKLNCRIYDSCDSCSC